MTANVWGRFIAEMEATEQGGKLTGLATDGKGPLILYGILSLAGAVQWGKNLMDAYSKFEPLLKAYQAQQAASENIRQQHEQQSGGIAL